MGGSLCSMGGAFRASPPELGRNSRGAEHGQDACHEAEGFHHAGQVASH